MIELKGKNQETGGDNNSFVKKIWLSFGVYGAIVLLLASFAGGVLLGQSREKSLQEKIGKLNDKNTPPPAYVGKDVNMQQFWKVWDTVKTSYLRKPVEDPKLFYGSIKGAVAALGDPYSVFFDPDEAATFTSQLEGTFEGIGAQIGYRETQLIVIAPLPGTPAVKAGIKSGDAILKINGEDTTGMAIEIAITKIRGAKGTNVVLNIYREGTTEPFDVSITRDKIVVDSVTAKMIDIKGEEMTGNGGIALITISEFNQDTVSMFESLLLGLVKRDAKGVIIDLRGNPGGYLDAAVELPRDWIGDNPVVIQRHADGSEIPMSPKRKITPISLPTVVLVNKWSASASEIVTGALQDYGKATIVGEKTFGKGSVQEYIDDFADGSALKITTAEWLTPKKRSIDKKGLDPDVVVALTEEDIANKKDPQLDKAISVINEKENGKNARK